MEPQMWHIHGKVNLQKLNNLCIYFIQAVLFCCLDLLLDNPLDFKETLKIIHLPEANSYQHAELE